MSVQRPGQGSHCQLQSVGAEAYALCGDCSWRRTFLGLHPYRMAVDCLLVPCLLQLDAGAGYESVRALRRYRHQHGGGHAAAGEEHGAGSEPEDADEMCDVDCSNGAAEDSGFSRATGGAEASGVWMCLPQRPCMWQHAMQPWLLPL